MAETKKAGRPGRSQAEHEATRQKIIDIARNLFQEDGFQSVSLRKIAARAGCSPMAIYYYFDGKQAILRHIWDGIFADLLRRLSHCAQSAADAPERLKALSLLFIRYWQENRQSFCLIYLNTDAEAIELGYDVFSPRDSTVRKIYGLFVDALDACRADGRLQGPPATVMAQTLFTSIYGLLFCRMTIPEFDWLPEAEHADEMLGHFLRGYAADR